MGQNWYGTQSLNPTDSPTFDNLTLTGNLSCVGVIASGNISGVNGTLSTLTLTGAADGVAFNAGTFGMYMANNFFGSNNTAWEISDFNGNKFALRYKLTNTGVYETILYGKDEVWLAAGSVRNKTWGVVSSASIMAGYGNLGMDTTYYIGFCADPSVDTIAKRLDNTGLYFGAAGAEIKVVGAQQAAVADAAGGATVDAEARTAINALLARVRTHGLIAT